MDPLSKNSPLSGDSPLNENGSWNLDYDFRTNRQPFVMTLGTNIIIVSGELYSSDLKYYTRVSSAANLIDESLADPYPHYRCCMNGCKNSAHGAIRYPHAKVNVCNECLDEIQSIKVVKTDDPTGDGYKKVAVYKNLLCQSGNDGYRVVEQNILPIACHWYPKLLRVCFLDEPYHHLHLGLGVTIAVMTLSRNIFVDVCAPKWMIFQHTIFADFPREIIMLICESLMNT